jgi:hypothetical protein
MPSPPDLKGSQVLFKDLITAPEGVVPGAAQLRAAGRIDSTDLSFLVRGDARLDAAGRLDIYAGMYFYRLRDALAEDYPRVVAMIGGARFHNLITDFLLVHPSRSWSLRFVGEPLAGFIDTHALSRQFPSLADLARLEWARIEAFDDVDAEPIGRERIAGLAQDRIATLRLGLVPACRLLSLAHPVAPLWLALTAAGEALPAGGHDSEAAVGSSAFEEIPPATVAPPPREPAHLRVWRHGFKVYHRPVRPDEHACLMLLRDTGATLPEIGDRLLERAGPDEATRRMAALFELWLSEGVLRELPRP